MHFCDSLSDNNTEAYILSTLASKFNSSKCEIFLNNRVRINARSTERCVKVTYILNNSEDQQSN